ncbi:MAG: hypothetical protein DRO15_01300 [Thermoprotei archaeon]|nr:MAG: hypothetical protein DRO15_01300 [Thermoprotei archaeon]
MIRRAMKFNGVVTAYVYGDFGHGKTSYALWTAYEVLGDWGKVLKYLFFDPREAVRVMGRAIYDGVRLPIIIMDDAGLWLDRLTWWERDKVAFMEFFNLIRSVAAGIIFTTPSEDLPKAILKKSFFRIAVSPVSRDRVVEIVGVNGYESLLNLAKKYGLAKEFCIATGYRLKTLPSFMNIVRKEFYDVYPLQYPIYREYEVKRREALKQYFEKWRSVVEGSKLVNKDDVIALIKELIIKGRPKSEIVKELRKLGVPRSTAYYWIKKYVEN